MEVVSNNRRPRASIRSFLPNLQLLTREKYPSKSPPDEEGKLPVSLLATFVSVEMHLGAAGWEVAI
jgi:hypothetical protein